MSDNDLIRRGDVFEAFCNHSEVIIHNGKPSFAVNYPSVIRSISTVPREMTAREYERAIDRAFRSDDDAYGEWADAIDEGNKDKAVAIIEKWAREHEERSEEND